MMLAIHWAGVVVATIVLIFLPLKKMSYQRQLAGCLMVAVTIAALVVWNVTVEERDLFEILTLRVTDRTSTAMIALYSLLFAFLGKLVARTLGVVRQDNLQEEDDT